MAEEKIPGLRYPLYEELPEGLVFLGDMVDFVNDVHAPLSPRAKHGKTFTAAMATNYMKCGLTPPAIGRRYGRDHVALVLFAATAKLSFNADDVLSLAQALFENKSVSSVHNALARAINDEVSGTALNEAQDPLSLFARAFVAKAQVLTALFPESGR